MGRTCTAHLLHANPYKLCLSKWEVISCFWLFMLVLVLQMAGCEDMTPKRHPSRQNASVNDVWCQMRQVGTPAFAGVIPADAIQFLWNCASTPPQGHQGHVSSAPAPSVSEFVLARHEILPSMLSSRLPYATVRGQDPFANPNRAHPPPSGNPHTR